MSLYSLFIADDEDLIRQGLISHIVWNKIGFQVVDSADNGQDAIEYLSKYPVDVILTDIKMPLATGIDIARFVCEKQLQTKVILLSGYKEFDLAKSAIEYGVKSYLLKPTKLDEIYKTFHALKQELDNEKQTKEHQAEIQKQYDEALEMLKEQMLTDLLFMKSPKINHPALGRCGIKLDRPYLCLCILSILNYHRAIEEKWHYERDLLIVALNNIITKTLGADIYCYTVQLFDHQLCLLLNAHSENRLHTGIAGIVKNINELLGIHIHAACSKPFEQFSQIPAVFEKMRQEAATHLETEPKHQEKSLKKETASGTSGSLPSLSGEVQYPVAKEHLLISYLSTCDPEKTFAMIDDLFEGLSAQQATKENINLFCAEFLVGLSRYLQEIRISLRDIAGCKVHPGMDFNALGTVMDIRDWFREICSRIIIYVRNNRESTDTKIISIIKEYINKNLDRDISLNIIANLVYLNPVYLSKFFKKQTGENFIDYLIRVRIEKAKELLKDMTLKVGEVSEMVGYKNTKHFFKTFKSYTGSKPSEYRDRLINKGLV